VAAPLRLHEQALVLITTDVQRPLSAPDAAAPVQALVRALNELAAQRDQLGATSLPKWRRPAAAWRRNATAWPR
jgi:hypothetical protein